MSVTRAKRTGRKTTHLKDDDCESDVCRDCRLVKWDESYSLMFATGEYPEEPGEGPEEDDEP